MAEEQADGVCSWQDALQRQNASDQRDAAAQQEAFREQVLAAAMRLFAERGLKFTMQQVASAMHVSKKTVYTVFPSKEALLTSMVDTTFEAIHRSKQELLDGKSTTLEKLHTVIIAMPDELGALDLRQMDELEERYPAVAARVREQLETGWEPTFSLLEQAMAEGVIRRVPLPVIQTMVTASIEAFLADRALEERGISYAEALELMVSVLMEGLVTR